MVTTLEGGAVVGGYKIRSFLFSTAAFGAYSAVDRRGTSVCLLCSEAHAQRPNDEAFASGLAALKALDIEGLPKVLSGGREDALSWIATDAIGATEPCWTLGRERLHWIRVLTVVKKVGRAFHFAAEAGVAHGDLEPECIRRYSNGSPCVVGMGALALFGLRPGAERASSRYTAPEQLSDQHHDHETNDSADIYALGMWMYAALTGQEPFESAANGELISLVKHGSPAVVPRLGVPFDVWELLSSVIEKRPEVRLGTWATVVSMTLMVITRALDKAREEGSDPKLEEVCAELALEELERCSPKELREMLQNMKARDREPDGGADEEPGADQESEPESAKLPPTASLPAPERVSPNPSIEDEPERPTQRAAQPIVPVALVLPAVVANDVGLPSADRRRRGMVVGGALLALACALLVWIAEPRDTVPTGAPSAVYRFAPPIMALSPTALPGAPPGAEPSPPLRTSSAKKQQRAVVRTAAVGANPWPGVCGEYLYCDKPIKLFNRGDL